MMRTRIRRTAISCVSAGILILMLAVGASAQSNFNDILQDFSWRNIGPSNMSGRISDIEALDTDFRYVLIATASGGVYKSTNAGTTWQPIFDNYGSGNIGDIAIFQPNPEILWVGTGECNTRNSIGWGDGIYKSTDGGETFTNMGLRDTHHIKRVTLHPTDEDIAYVAAQGHLWGYNDDRGLFKTEDGGKSWNKLTNGLPDDGKTGATDVLMDPENPDVLYAAFWERIRRPYRFDSGGPNGGLFKTEDGGKSWTKLTNGLPEGDTGKIGLAIYRKNPDIIMAMVEHGVQLEEDHPDYDNMRVLGSGIYRSENGGKSWKYVNRYNNRPFYYSHIRINPLDDKIVYIVTGSFYISYDGGESMELQETNHHGDYHALWSDPLNGDRFYIGSDGGAALTHDHGESYIFYHNLVAAQFYAVGADMREPYWVFGGLQDNGTWGGPSKVRDPNGILKDHWIKIGGGDGFYAQIDPEDWRTVYYESQGGNMNRRNIHTGESASIRPGRENIINYDEYITPEIEQSMREQDYRGAFRFNWSTPILLSSHNSHTIYTGGNHLFKTVDRGNSWQIISPDLTTNDPVKTNRESGGLTPDITGAETHCTIVTIAESPLNPKILWAGTDDGNVHVSRTGGENWSNVRFNIRDVPDEIWVSRVEASHFNEGTAYVTFDGHRSDNFTPWIFKTTDFGAHWTNITNTIPHGHPIYVIREDPINPDLLFAGSEFACFVTLDGGTTWNRFMNNAPTVPYHDLVIHPRDGDLIAATHGRGVWIADDITPLQQLAGEVLQQDMYLFEPRPGTQWLRIQKNDPRMGHLYFSGENPDPTAAISYYLKDDAAGDVELQISDIGRENSFITLLPFEQGLHKYEWNMRWSPTEQQRTQFVSQFTETLESIREEVDTRDERRQIDLFREQLESARTDDERLEIQEAFLEMFSDYAALTRRFSREGLSGSQVPAGEYFVQLSAGGEILTRILTVKDDPLLSRER
ncbi:WD40/YVTN/BNR-like repeat-containing protein [candidate division KSB1 bacterium]